MSRLDRPRRSQRGHPATDLLTGRRGLGQLEHGRRLFGHLGNRQTRCPVRVSRGQLSPRPLEGPGSFRGAPRGGLSTSPDSAIPARDRQSSRCGGPHGRSSAAAARPRHRIVPSFRRSATHRRQGSCEALLSKIDLLAVRVPPVGSDLRQLRFDGPSPIPCKPWLLG